MQRLSKEIHCSTRLSWPNVSVKCLQWNAAGVKFYSSLGRRKLGDSSLKDLCRVLWGLSISWLTTRKTLNNIILVRRISTKALFFCQVINSSVYFGLTVTLWSITAHQNIILRFEPPADSRRGGGSASRRPQLCRFSFLVYHYFTVVVGDCSLAVWSHFNSGELNLRFARVIFYLGKKHRWHLKI